jgi:PAS domain S-box-containing protein
MLGWPQVSTVGRRKKKESSAWGLGAETDHEKTQRMTRRGRPEPDSPVGERSVEMVAEARFRALVLRSSDITTVLEPDGRWRWSSPAASRVLGYPEDFELDSGIFSLLHPDDVEPARAAFREVIDGARGPDDPIVLRVEAADGSWRRLETVASSLVDDEAIHGVVLHSRDVTERVQIEEQLRVSERRFRAIVQHASDVVTIADAEGTIVYTSPSMERVLGYGPDELVGTQTRDLMHPHDVVRVEEAVTEQFMAGGVEAPIEYRARHRDGSWRVVEGVIANLLDEPGICGVVGPIAISPTRLRLRLRCASPGSGSRTSCGTRRIWSQSPMQRV